MVLAVLWAVLGRVLMASNSAAWEQEWRQVAPLWSRGEGGAADPRSSRQAPRSTAG